MKIKANYSEIIVFPNRSYEKNDFNDSSMTPINIAVSIEIILVCSVGLVLDIFMVMANAKIFMEKHNTFWLLYMDMLTSDLLFFILYLIYTAPCTVVGYQIYHDWIGEAIFGTIETSLYCKTVTSSLIITLNRMVNIFWPGKMTAIFPSKTFSLLVYFQVFIEKFI